MKRNLLLFITGFLFCYGSLAQDKISAVKLIPVDIKKKNLSFHFKNVEFERSVSDTLGIIASRKNKENTIAVLGGNKEKEFQQFLETQFSQNEKGTPVILNVKKIKLAPTQAGIFNQTDTFQFQCDFIGILNNERTTLYSFNAKNQFGTFENPEIVMSNYIVRALISGVEKFKESYDKKAEWHQEFQNNSDMDKKPVKVTVTYNKMNPKDSIPCLINEKLRWEYFQENTKDNTDLGSAKFILTYKVLADETSKHLKLDIFVSAFFNKRNSWKPKGANDESWLRYQQGHYDICAAYGMRLQNQMRNYQYSLGEYRTELNKIYNEQYSEYVKLRKQYETETAVGTNINQMNSWRQKIDKLMIEAKK